MELSCQTSRMLDIVEVKDVVYKHIKVPTITQYIHRFIRKIKDILRPLDNLNGVLVHISVLDLNNTIHEWIVSALYILKDMIHLHIRLEHSVFIYIRKKTTILFIGNIQF